MTIGDKQHPLFIILPIVAMDVCGCYQLFLLISLWFISYHHKRSKYFTTPNKMIYFFSRNLKKKVMKLYCLYIEPLSMKQLNHRMKSHLSVEWWLNDGWMATEWWRERWISVALQSPFRYHLVDWMPGTFQWPFSQLILKIKKIAPNADRTRNVRIQVKAL